MSALSKLIGEKVIKNSADETSTTLLEGSGKVLGLYFSAHWCPPCRAFTPQLAQWYSRFKESSNGSNFNIVFLSSDKTIDEFKEYFKEMPWYAVPYAARQIKNDLSRKYKVAGIPALVFVNAENGQTITTDGRSIVMEDPDGKEFPWTPKPVLELLCGNLIAKNETTTTWKTVHSDMDYVGIYFSAHWCGPCRAFTPQLVSTYNELKKAGKKFEIIFCSSDREEGSFRDYYSDMPWLALPYGDSRKKSLSRVFDVTGIPTLVILDKEGKVVTNSGRGAVMSDPDGLTFPWEPKPANMLTGTTAADINQSPAIIWFTDGKEESVATARSTMELIALECKKGSPDSELLFYYTGSEDDEEVIQSLREFANLPNTTPLLAIVDIPKQVKYVSDAEINEKAVRDMVKDYKGGSLNGQPLRNP